MTELKNLGQMEIGAGGDTVKHELSKNPGDIPAIGQMKISSGFT